MKKIYILVLLSIISISSAAQKSSTIKIDGTHTGVIIPADLYGQFAEHLGTGIYGGIWVGKDSPIPNTEGDRNDVLKALKELDVPVIRWPGGCFADYYHWKDGIGPQETRPSITNALWGGTIEDNSFGTHEFLNLCELIGCEPYISANVGSGTVQEMAEWVDYMTAAGGPMAELRKQNGREKPWDVKYIGVGNESWGCGGQMTPEYYSDLYRRYAEFCRKIGGRPLYKVASGASDYDFNWTEVLMQGIGQRMNGISLHYYTVNWNDKGLATGFSDEKYYWTISKCLGIEDVLKRHISIMDKYDPSGRIGLIVDEWGTWWDQEPGSVDGHLYQQNSMRDAIVAALSFDVFHRYTDRVKMTNIAQMVNVLQSMILTSGEKMVLTPTYYIFDMYKVHRDAELVGLDIQTDSLKLSGETVPAISATASRDTTGAVHLSITNISLKDAQKVTIVLDTTQVNGVGGQDDSGTPSGKVMKKHKNASSSKLSRKVKTPYTIAGIILTSKSIDDCNTFASPEKVLPREFTDATMKNGILEVDLPARSVVTLSLIR